MSKTKCSSSSTSATLRIHFFQLVYCLHLIAANNILHSFEKGIQAHLSIKYHSFPTPINSMFFTHLSTPWMYTFFTQSWDRKTRWYYKDVMSSISLQCIGILLLSHHSCNTFSNTCNLLDSFSAQEYKVVIIHRLPKTPVQENRTTQWNTFMKVLHTF